MDPSEDGRKFHEGNVDTFKAALALGQGAHGLSAEIIALRLQTAQSRELNLREERLKVGMMVCRKVPS